MEGAQNRQRRAVTIRKARKARVHNRRARTALLVAVLGLAWLHARADDLTSSVQITLGGLVLNRVTNTFDASVTVKNISASTILGPLQLVLTSATPADVALYNRRGQIPSGADFLIVALPSGTLAPGASSTTIVSLISSKNTIRSTTFSVNGQRLIPGQTATLTIQGVYAAGYQSPQESALGAGYDVVVNGIVRGVTDASGQLTVVVPAGQANVAVSLPPNEGGIARAVVTAGSSTAIKVAIDDGKEISSDGVLRIDAVSQGLLSRNAARIAARFKDSHDQSVKLTMVTDVTLQDITGHAQNLTSLFSPQADGSVAASTPATFYSAVGTMSGRLTLTIGGEDAHGNIYQGSADFHLTDHQARVQLVAPPSNPGLPLANVRVTATILSTTLHFQAQSDANGWVVLPDLPRGNLSLLAVATAGGINYTGSGTAALSYDALISLTMRGPHDVLANVSPISIQALTENLGN